MFTRRRIGVLLLGAGAFLMARPLVRRLFAQDQAPNRPGTFSFYSNLTSDRAHAEMQGQLVVRPR